VTEEENTKLGTETLLERIDKRTETSINLPVTEEENKAGY
jgi:hypothetical protein